jgi:WD40 repeat protein
MEKVTSVTFSPDGEYILTGSCDRTARLWDMKGNQLKTFREHEGIITSVAFSRSGKYILTGSIDKTAHLYEFITVEDFLKKGDFEKLSKKQLQKYGIED